MTRTPDPSGAGPPSTGPTLWVYGYELTPLGNEHRVRTIRAVIARENRAARRAAVTWTARLILAQHGAQLLIVSTSPDRDGESNRRLETELTTLGIDFNVTVPMKVTEPARDDS